MLFYIRMLIEDWLERTLIYLSKNHDLCIPFGQNFNLKLLIAPYFCELLCRCIQKLLLLNSYSILAADFYMHFFTKASSQSLERPYRETPGMKTLFLLPPFLKIFFFTLVWLTFCFTCVLRSTLHRVLVNGQERYSVRPHSHQHHLIKFYLDFIFAELGW